MSTITITCNHCGATVTSYIDDALAWDKVHQEGHR